MLPRASICRCICQGARINLIYQLRTCEIASGSILCPTSGVINEQRRFKRKSPFKRPSKEEEWKAKAKYDQNTKRLLDQMTDFEPEKLAPVVDSIGFIINPYVPKERKPSIFTTEGLRYRLAAFKMLMKSTYSVALIRRYAKPFKVKDFAKYAQLLFIDTNVALQRNDVYKLEQVATVNVYKALLKEYQSPLRKLDWHFVKELERPRVVQASVAPVREKTNLFGQVTVRLCSEQVLAIKDSRGKVVKGDESKSKKVIDYVVLERHLTNEYGKWRVCGKVSPAVITST